MQCANIQFTAVLPPLVGTESPKQLVPEAVLAWGLGDKLEGNKGETKPLPKWIHFDSCHRATSCLRYLQQETWSNSFTALHLGVKCQAQIPFASGSLKSWICWIQCGHFLMPPSRHQPLQTLDSKIMYNSWSCSCEGAKASVSFVEMSYIRMIFYNPNSRKTHSVWTNGSIHLRSKIHMMFQSSVRAARHALPHIHESDPCLKHQVMESLNLLALLTM